MINYTVNKIIPSKCYYDLVEIFSTNNWPEADNPRIALYGLNMSNFLVLAFHGKKLVGLARASGDNVWCATIDAVCVHKDYQRQGIGSELIRQLLNELSDCQYISVSPNCSSNIPFYEKLGFAKVEDGSLLQIERSV